MATSELVKEYLFSDAMDIATVRKHQKRLGDESYLAFLDGLISARPKRPTIDYPVLVIGAENDRLVGMDDNRLTSEFFSGELHQISNIAHNLMNDAGWQKTAEVMAKFFDKIAPNLKSK